MQLGHAGNTSHTVKCEVKLHGRTQKFLNGRGVGERGAQHLRFPKGRGLLPHVGRPSEASDFHIVFTVTFGRRGGGGPDPLKPVAQGKGAIHARRGHRRG